MKKSLLILVCAFFTSVVFADIEAKAVTTTVTSNGTITEYTPATTFVVKETTGPVMYRYGDNVLYTTSSGRILTSDELKTRIRIGIPVTVHYMRQGDTRMLSRVVVEDDDDDDDDDD